MDQQLQSGVNKNFDNLFETDLGKAMDVLQTLLLESGESFNVLFC